MIKARFLYVAEQCPRSVPPEVSAQKDARRELAVNSVIAVTVAGTAPLVPQQIIRASEHSQHLSQGVKQVFTFYFNLKIYHKKHYK